MIKFLTFHKLFRNYDIRAKTHYHIFPPKWRWLARAQYLVLGKSRISIVVVPVLQSKALYYLLFPRFRSLCIEWFWASFISDSDDSENRHLVSYHSEKCFIFNSTHTPPCKSYGCYLLPHVWTTVTGTLFTLNSCFTNKIETTWYFTGVYIIIRLITTGWKPHPSWQPLLLG